MKINKFRNSSPHLTSLFKSLNVPAANMYQSTGENFILMFFLATRISRAILGINYKSNTFNEMQLSGQCENACSDLPVNKLLQ